MLFRVPQLLAALGDPIIAAISIPLVMLMTGACARKLIRGDGWKRHDFYLGVEFSLAALTAGLANLSAIAARPDTTPAESGRALTLIALFLASCFLFLLIVMSIHQDRTPEINQSPTKEILWLGLVSNVIGLGLLAVFVVVFRIA